MNLIRTEFGSLLLKAISNKGLSLRAFAKKGRITVSSLSQIVNGKRPPPRAHLLHWIELLELDQKTREEITILAYLSHTSPEIIAYVNQLKNGILVLQAENRRLLAALACIDNPLESQAGLLDCMACRSTQLLKRAKDKKTKDK